MRLMSEKNAKACFLRVCKGCFVDIPEMFFELFQKRRGVSFRSIVVCFSINRLYDRIILIGGGKLLCRLIYDGDRAAFSENFSKKIIFF